MGIGIFVTGTDTGVGKTLAACALLRAVASRGRSCVGMKPVAAGSEGGRWPDVDALIAASTVKAERALVNPYALDEPLAPHIAAAKQGVEISVTRIVEAYRALAEAADVVVVEGAGGFLVPVMEDVAKALALPVVLVVGMRLGCLNHALLTREAIAARGLRCAGWIANSLSEGMAELEANMATLQARLAAPLLGRIPYRPREADRYLSVDSLLP